MIEKGEIVRSLQGHDKDRLYVVIGVANDFAYVVDGKYRKKDKPKKKRIKHIKDEFKSFHKDIDTAYDYEIATALKNI